MWKETSMNFVQSLTVSGLGLTTVFLTLIVLALAIIIFSKIFSAANGSAKTIQTGAGQKQVSASEEDNDALAVIVAVVSEEMNMPVDEFQITHIREI